MIWIDLEETNRSAHRVTVNSRGPRTKPSEYWWQKTRDKVLVLLTQERVYHYFFRHECCKGDKKWSCHVLNATWVFFTLVENDKVEHLPVPFDIITPFSSTPTIAATPHKRDWVPIAICTSPVIHLVCPPKHSVYSLSSISLRTTVTLRRTCRLRFSLEGAHKVYYKRPVQMGNAVCEKRSL